MSVFQGAKRAEGSTGPVTPDPTTTVAPGEASTKDVAAEPAPDLESMTVPQLHELCKERGVRVAKKATKAQLLAALAE